MKMHKQNSKTKIVITIDGYSSTGKSSFAKQIAARQSFLHIDTGAIYRTITLYALRNDFISPDLNIRKDDLIHSFDNLNITLETSGSSTLTYLDGENVEKEIRSMLISDHVSHIASIREVRKFVNNILYSICHSFDIVVDGRDMGTAVFPEADLKIFMTASKEIRAQRRLKELQEKGIQANYEEVLENLLKRDHLDETREIAPLKKAEDALILDNSHMSVEEQLKWVDTILTERNLKCR